MYSQIVPPLPSYPVFWAAVGGLDVVRMKTNISLRFFRLAVIFLAAYTFARAEDDPQDPRPTQFEVNEKQLRKEIETAEEVPLVAPWDDQKKWEMTDYYPPKGLISEAYKILREAGYDDLVDQGAIYYSVGENKHLLLITSTTSTPILAKYYCLAYDDQSKAPLTPVKVWAKYREVIHKFTNADLDLTTKAKGGAGEPATRSGSNSEGDDKPKPESEGRSR